VMKEHLIVGLDVPSLGEAEEIVEELSDRVGFFKIGLELFAAAGPAAVEMVHRHGQRVFLDLKLNDIPNTVAGAARHIAAMGVGMMTMHAMAGTAAMGAAQAAAVAAADAAGWPAPLVLGVTVLTSLNQEDLTAQNICVPVDRQVISLAGQAKASGLGGVVCAGAEARKIKESCGSNFRTVVPGIRPAWAAGNDQKRTMTPAEAIANGADYLVVVRPILAAENRREALSKILEEMRQSFYNH